MAFKKRGKVGFKQPHNVAKRKVELITREEAEAIEEEKKSNIVEKKLGDPGTIDLDGIWIPKYYKRGYGKSRYHRNKRIAKSKDGTIKTPLRRSLYSGKRFFKSSDITHSDNKYSLLCSDRDYFDSLMSIVTEKYKVSKREYRAIRRYVDYVYNTGQRLGTSDKFVKQDEGYMTVEGVVKIRKVLKERENLLPEDQKQMPSGVVLKDDLE